MEIPEHLRLRAEAHRSQRAPTATPLTTVPVPIEALEDLRARYEGHDGYVMSNVAPAIEALVALIPEPPYAPDDGLVNATARALAIASTTARKILVELHAAGLEVTRPDA
jgi:hypothetical protein